METKRKALGRGLEELFSNEPLDIAKVEELFAGLKELEEDTRENHILKVYIYSLEMKFKAFATYGDKLITREDLYSLYKLKFRIYTDELKPSDPPIIENASLVEIECYEDIVSAQINDIVMGTNSNLSQIKLPRKKTVLEIKNVLQNKEGEFSPWHILSNNYRLLFFVLKHL